MLAAKIRRPALCWPQPDRRLAAETLIAGVPFAIRPLPLPARPTAAERWWPALLALLVGLGTLVVALGWEVRQGRGERLSLQADLAALAASTAATEAELRALLAETTATGARQRDEIAGQREEIGRLAAGLAARTLQAGGLQRALASQQARAEAAEADAGEQRRQLAERQAERDALAEQLSRREAELAQANERLDALQQRVTELEALARKVRQTLGLPAPAGPAGGDLAAASEAALLARLEALDARAAAAGDDLAGSERALRERLAALRQLAAASQAVRLSPAAAARAPVGWPAAGPISSPFGPRLSPIDGQPRFHPGVDIVVAAGTPVRATQAGEVVQAGMSGDYGLMIVVRHVGGFETLYGHNSRLLVRPGQAVERGQVLAYSGNTGTSTGPHLHYEVRYQGQMLDPAPLLRAGGQ
jgi:murein DD-endopeptidase MepM/ murein hydrolase activator NlpD